MGDASKWMPISDAKRQTLLDGAYTIPTKVPNDGSRPDPGRRSLRLW